MKKLIAEFRVNSHILFYKEKEEIAKELLGEFPDWQTDSLMFNLINKKKKQYCVLEHNRIAVVDEDNHSEHDFYKLVEKVLVTYGNKLEIDNIERAGIRFQVGVKTKLKSEELVKLFQEKFYPNSKEVEKLFVKDFHDVSFSGVYIKDGNKFQFGTGPAADAEVSSRMDLRFRPDDKEFSKTMLFIDYDGFKQNLKATELDNTIKSIKSELQKTVEGILKMFKLTY